MMEDMIEPVDQPTLDDAMLDDVDEEAGEVAEAARTLAMDDFGKTLEKLKDEAIEYRIEHERFWSEAGRQFNGESFDDTPRTKQIANNEDDYRRTRDNITRSKTLIIESRLSDMLFPNGDSGSGNWDMEHTAKPELPDGEVQEADEEGNPLDPLAIRLARDAAAKKRADAMRRTIRDQLGECDYSAQGRAMLGQAVLYGTGVMKGPILKTTVKRRWSVSTKSFEATFTGDTTPAAKHVDLWSFYPQPSRTIDEAEHVFELNMMTRKRLRSLAMQPGFDPSQVKRLLDLDPVQNGLLQSSMMAGSNTTRTSQQATLSKRYAVWEYSGPVQKGDVGAFLVGLYASEKIDADDMAQLTAVLEKHSMDEIECNVWFSQGIVLKVALPFMETGDRLRYYVFNYETNPESIFGYGVPYLMADDQVAANQLWHAIVLNSMVSAAPQIGVKKTALIPMSGQAGGRAFHLGVAKPRVWAMNDEIDDIKQALSVFNIPNVAGALLPVYERIKANADEHTMTPIAFQGGTSSVQSTSSGTAMRMNSDNIVMRRLAKNFDDQVTTPLIRAFYDFNMDPSLNPDPEVKGDFKVIPKAVSHLLVKDIQAQHMQFATQMFSSNQMLQPFMKPYKWAVGNLEFLDISAEDFLYTEEELQAQQSQQPEPPPDPNMTRAQAQQAQADAALKRAENDAQRIQVQATLDNQDRQLDNQEHQEQIALRERLAETKQQIEAAKLALASASLDQQGQVAMQKLLTQLQVADKAMETQRYRADLKATTDAERIMREASARLGGATQ